MRPRRAHANIIQKGRFADDQQFWVGRLSNPKLVHRLAGADLGFNLHSKADFEFFQRTIEQDIATFQWLPGGKKGEESPEDDEDNE